jgi:ABC-type Mn2+/Zn2+ transport system permease subunit
VPSLLLLLLFLRPILYAFLDREASRVLGLRCWFWEGLFFFLLGLVVSGASKSGGALLVFCLLVVVPATALLLARRLWSVIVISVALGVLTTWGGLLTAYSADLPSNPTIIGISCMLLMSVALVRSAATALVARR